MTDTYFQILFFGGAFLITLAVTPLVKKLAHSYNVTAASGGRRIHQGAVPLLGGVAIYAPIFLVFLIFLAYWIFDALPFYQPNISQIIALFIGSLAMVILGAVDDKYKISWKFKLLGQLLAAVILVLGGHTIRSATLPLIGPVFFDWLGAPLFIIAVIGITNAINIIDGIDGLAGGICMMAALTTGIIGFVQGDPFAATLGFTIAGATMAFLFYNFPPASIFMGDGGSIMLGFLLGTLAMSSTAVYPGLRLGASAMIAIPFIPFTIPIFETVLSIARRWLRGQPIFSGDGDHLHHRLIRALRNPRRTVLIFYFFTFICCIFTLILTLQPRSDLARMVFVMTGLVLLTGAIAALSLYKLGEVFVAIRNRPYFRFLSSFRQFMALKMRRCGSITELIDLAEMGVKELGFDEIELVGMGYIIRRWRNQDKIHPDMPRITHEESYGEGRLRIKWVAPVHHDQGYNEYLQLTWRRFLNDLWAEVSKYDKQSKECGQYRSVGLFSR
jgi:UDP-GlcNAc:undecaprenyl-phosphate GlcNAc-1-phosphate transferase